MGDARGGVMVHVRSSRLLDLDGAGGHERRRGQARCRLGRDRADARRKEPGRGRAHDCAGSGRCGASDRRRLSGRARGRGARARAGARGVADVQDRELAQQEEPPEGEHGGELLARLVELALEGRAAVACPQVPADQGPGAALEALGDFGKLDANLLAGEQSRLRGLGQ